MSAPIHGLLLAGGKSRRMGTDKAELVVDDGLTLRDRSMEILATFTEPAFLSVAADESRSFDYAVLPDRSPDIGPLAGLDAAFAEDPAAAWLLLACDLPLLTSEVLSDLTAQRDPSADATCFLSRFDGKPEPLCTIYEPSAAARLQDALAGDVRCARKFLSSLERKDLTLPEDRLRALDNCNRPEDLEEARQLSLHGRLQKDLAVDYCGALHEQAGTRAEAVTTYAATAAGVWEELRMKHEFTLDLDGVRVAINDEFQPWTHPLNHNDRLALFPPFAGG